MNITKSQSMVIAIGAIVLFFVIGVVFLKTNSHTVQFSQQNSTPAKEATLAPPPPLATATPGASAATDTSQSSSSSAAALGSGVFTLNGFDRSESEGDRKLWQMHGTEAQFFPNSNATKIEHSHMVMTSRQGKTTDITSKQATIYMNGPLLAKADLEQDVVAVYNNEYTITTDKAICDRVANTLTVPTRVKIVGSALDLTADKLDGKLDTEVFVFSGNVVTIMKSDPTKNSSPDKAADKTKKSPSDKKPTK